MGLAERLRERFDREHLVRSMSLPRSAGGGPYLHWVPDGRAGWRLAGDLLPTEPDGRRTGRGPAPRS